MKLDCGCAFGEKDGTFFVSPCSATCDYYAYAVEQARKRGIAIGTLDLRDTGEMSARACPFCNRKLDAYNSDDRRNRPKPGDASLCAYCLRVSFFTADGMRKPTEAEQKEVDANPQIEAYKRAAGMIFKDKS